MQKVKWRDLRMNLWFSFSLNHARRKVKSLALVHVNSQRSRCASSQISRSNARTDRASCSADVSRNDWVRLFFSEELCWPSTAGKKRRKRKTTQMRHALTDVFKRDRQGNGKKWEMDLAWRTLHLPAPQSEIMPVSKRKFITLDGLVIEQAWWWITEAERTIPLADQWPIRGWRIVSVSERSALNEKAVRRNMRDVFDDFDEFSSHEKTPFAGRLVTRTRDSILRVAK